MAYRFLVLLALCLAPAAALADNPSPGYQHPPPPPHGGSYHVPERNCSVDFEKSETELCVPTLETQCSKEEVTLMVPKEAEKCITVTTTNCKAEVEKVESEICVYVYEKKDLEAEAKVVDVKYTKRCDTNYVSMCKKKQVSYHGGHSPYGKQEEECKEVPQETCYNKPQAESKTRKVTVTAPQPVKRCETKRINLPSVSCEEEKEERCFTVVNLEETTQEIEKCVTSLGEPKCNKISLELPAQKCEEQLKEYKRQYGAR